MKSRIVRSPLFERSAAEPLIAATVPLGRVPLVSVVMTTFNSRAWLKRAIESVLLQTWRNLELLIIDDASMDGSARMALDYAGRNPRVRVFSMRENWGTYRAKNVGIFYANGEVLTFMDSDDYSTPSRLEAQLEQLRRAGIVASTCDYERRDEEGQIVLNQGLRQRQALISLMIKREVVDEIGWFHDVRTSADDEFFERIRHTYGRQAHKNVPSVHYVALHRADSISQQGSAAMQLAGETSALSPARQAYVDAYRRWYAELARDGMRPYMPAISRETPFWPSACRSSD